MELKLNLGCGDNKLDGFVNLDKTNGFLFEAPLEYEDESVDAITISHALMYVAIDDLTNVFNDMFRVLKKVGVLRITEDCTDNPLSERYGGYFDAVTLTSQSMMKELLEASGFKTYIVDADTTYWKDKTLCQDFHGGEPKAFFIEAIKK